MDGKEEIYRDVRFFHGAIQTLLWSRQKHSRRNSSFKVVSQEMICETGMSLVVDKTDREDDDWTSGGKSSRGQMQQPEMNASRRLQDGMMM